MYVEIVDEELNQLCVPELRCLVHARVAWGAKEVEKKKVYCLGAPKNKKKSPCGRGGYLF